MSAIESEIERRVEKNDRKIKERGKNIVLKLISEIAEMKVNNPGDEKEIEGLKVILTEYVKEGILTEVEMEEEMKERMRFYRQNNKAKRK